MTGLSPATTLESIFRTALHRCHPAMRLPSRLPRWLSAHGLGSSPRLHLFASGKAAEPMASAAWACLRDQVVGGLVITPNEAEAIPAPLQVLVSDHPIPTIRSQEAAHRLRRALSSLGPQDEYLFLLSGGTSSLMEIPRDPLTLEELQQAWRLLLRSGLDIHRVNRIRARLSAVKAGGLLHGIQARGLVVVMSDVPGDDLAKVGSGPLHPLPDDPALDPVTVLKEAGIWDAFPSTARRLVASPDETRPDRPPTPPHVRLASNLTLIREACRVSSELGLHPRIHKDPLSGEARTTGAAFARHCLERQTRPGPAREILVTGGETTVTIRNPGEGLGGRNQEAALSAVLTLRGRPGITMLFAGSDGIDGPTPAAGAIASPDAWRRAHGLSQSLTTALDHHNSHPVWKRLGGLLVTGPTGINLMDLAIALIER